MCGLIGGHKLAYITADGRVPYSNISLRNVAPKPLLHERWVALWGDGEYSSFFASYDACKDSHKYADEAEIRRIVWNSDGSPVVSDAPDAPWKENSEYWKAKAEALQAELASARAALRDLGAINPYVAATWTEAYPEHAPAIAAARAEKENTP
jgi:hypothetical protein